MRAIGVKFGAKRHNGDWPKKEFISFRILRRVQEEINRMRQKFPAETNKYDGNDADAKMKDPADYIHAAGKIPEGCALYDAGIVLFCCVFCIFRCFFFLFFFFFFLVCFIFLNVWFCFVVFCCFVTSALQDAKGTI